jgi:hypothetical protein
MSESISKLKILAIVSIRTILPRVVDEIKYIINKSMIRKYRVSEDSECGMSIKSVYNMILNKDKVSIGNTDLMRSVDRVDSDVNEHLKYISSILSTLDVMSSSVLSCNVDDFTGEMEKFSGFVSSLTDNNSVRFIGFVKDGKNMRPYLPVLVSLVGDFGFGKSFVDIGFKDRFNALIYLIMGVNYFYGNITGPEEIDSFITRIRNLFDHADISISDEEMEILKNKAEKMDT